MSTNSSSNTGGPGDEEPQSSPSSSSPPPPPPPPPFPSPVPPGAQWRRTHRDDEDENDIQPGIDEVWAKAMKTVPMPASRLKTEEDSVSGSSSAAPPDNSGGDAPPSVDQLWLKAQQRVPRVSGNNSGDTRLSGSGSRSRQSMKNTNAIPKLLALLSVIALLLVVIYHPFARERAGGPLTTGGLALGIVFLIYLQPPVQRFFEGFDRAKRRRNRDRRHRQRQYQMEEQKYLDHMRRKQGDP